MREKMARALTPVSWSNLDAGRSRDGDQATRDRSLEIADSILDAMREMTDLMGNGLPEGYKPGSHSATQIWRALIDAAKSGA